jgi:dihydropteroate synthase
MTSSQFLKWLNDSQRRPLVMGVLNITPDSFSDGVKYASTEAASARAQELIRQGADLLDIGGESICGARGANRASGSRHSSDP